MTTIRHYALSYCASLLLLLVAAPVHAGCTADPWDSDTSYVRGNTVSDQLHEWSAKRSSTGVVPGTHKPTWRDLGQCDSGEPPSPPPPPPPTTSTPIQIYGLWHAGDHYADWAFLRDMDKFDAANRWIIEHVAEDDDLSPSVNLVVLSFVHPMRLLNKTNDASTVSGVPIGMTQDVVDYFKDADIRVMMSIGGVTYTDAWDEALALNAELLGLNAAEVANEFGVGIEIDYERNTDPNLEGLEEFIKAYRSIHPYDPSGANHAARLTIDLAAGGRYLQDLNRYATIHWLDNADPILDYANAMVHRSSGSPANWQEHVDGKPTYDPPIPPKAPNRFTGGLYLKGNMDNCTDFYGSEQFKHAEYVQTVTPNGAGLSAGMLGFMFWAAETPSARKNYVPTTPPNSCEDGMGVAATVFDLLIPMEALRKD
jgi:hypothetical protein